MFWNLEKLPTPFSESMPSSVCLSSGMLMSQGVQTIFIPIHPVDGKDHRWRFRFIPIPNRVYREISFSTRFCQIVSLPSAEGYSANDNRVQEAGFKTGQMREGKGGAWTNYTGGIATAWTGVKV